MNSKEALDQIAALRERYGIFLDSSSWVGEEIFGGVAVTDEIVVALGVAAREFDDQRAVVYEMETTEKEFAPLDIALDRDGFDVLRRQMMAHFDLVMVPPSRKWAYIMSHELEGLLLGPKHFLATFSAEAGRSNSTA